MEIKGKCIEVLPLVIGDGKNGQWSKQTVVIETLDEKYPKKIACVLWGDKCGTLQVGQVATLSIEIESREFGGKWYTDVKAWKVEISTPRQEQPNIVQPDGDLPF